MDKMKADHILRDVVTTMKTQLPQDLRAVLEDTLRPDLISLLREKLLEKLLTNVKASQDEHFEKLFARVFEPYNDLSTDIKWMKEQIGRPSLVQEQIDSAMSGAKTPRKLQWVPEASTTAPVDNDNVENEESLANM
jgi:hypothetical protein